MGEESSRWKRNRFGFSVAIVVTLFSASVALATAGHGLRGGSPIAAAQYQYGKATICHHTHSKTNPQVAITISVNALHAHLGHGDTVGPCPAT